jgi:hypothetical protein
VTVTDLENPGHSIQGILVNVSGHGFGLLLEQPLPINTAVRVDLHDAMLLGEVCYCEPVAGGPGYGVGLRAEHVLTESNELAALMRSLMEEPGQPAETPQPEPERR